MNLSDYPVVSCNDHGIAQCARKVKEGGIVVFPTDTVYGIGCDPFNDSAVERVFRIKSRQSMKHLPVLVSDQKAAENLVDLDQDGRLLARRFWPGPLTIVAPLIEMQISRRVTAGADTLGVRVPAHSCTLALLAECRYLVGTSANLSGKLPPKTADDVRHSGLKGFDMLLDGGKVTGGIESTIYDITGRVIIREGAIPSATIRNVLEVGCS